MKIRMDPPIAQELIKEIIEPGRRLKERIEAYRASASCPDSDGDRLQS
jgi:hypothetical protein